jgi:hypothetical protein
MIGGMSYILPSLAEGECHPDLKLSSVTISLGIMAGLEPGKSE